MKLEEVTKSFGQTPVLDGISLEAAEGEFLTLLGPSGSGKTTLLRIIAGLLVPDAGRVLFGGRPVTGLPPNKRNVAMVFQDYALYPNMRVRDNIAFGLKMKKIPRDEITKRVQSVVRTLGIEDLLDRWPQELSGGQKQRVALGRAIVRNPEVFLLDEPLSNLDAQLRIAMRAELQKLHRRLAATMIHVTHDQEEAMSVSQRIALIKDGRVEQHGTPQELYRDPTNVFVARFIGAPSINLLPCSLLFEDGRWRVLGNHFSVTVPAGALAPRWDVDLHRVLMGIRPEDLAIVTESWPNAWVGEVSVVERLGKEVVVYLQTGADEEIVMRTVPGLVPNVGQKIAFAAKERDLYFFNAITGRTLMRQGRE